MSKSVFLDTNVVLDFLDLSRGGNSKAVSLIQYLVMNDWAIVISEDMLSTIFYIDKNSDRVLNFFKKITQEWRISPFGLEVVKKSIEISLEKNLDLEDVLQCLCAKDNKCNSLITSDNNLVDCGLPIYTVDEFLIAKSS